VTLFAKSDLQRRSRNVFAQRAIVVSESDRAHSYLGAAALGLVRPSMSPPETEKYTRVSYPGIHRPEGVGQRDHRTQSHEKTNSDAKAQREHQACAARRVSAQSRLLV
jgi:hypothetical protein